MKTDGFTKIKIQFFPPLLYDDLSEIRVPCDREHRSVSVLRLSPLGPRPRQESRWRHLVFTLPKLQRSTSSLTILVLLHHWWVIWYSLFRSCKGVQAHLQSLFSYITGESFGLHSPEITNKYKLTYNPCSPTSLVSHLVFTLQKLQRSTSSLTIRVLLRQIFFELQIWEAKHRGQFMTPNTFSAYPIPLGVITKSQNKKINAKSVSVLPE